MAAAATPQGGSVIAHRSSFIAREAVDLLRGFAEKVEGVVNRPGAISAQVKVELGHLVDQGQEHRVVVRAPELGLSDYLVRAFIPFDGAPVVLDMLAEGERTCDSADTLVAALVELSEQPAMQQRLAAIRNLLAGASARGVEQGKAAPRPPAKAAKRHSS